MKSYNKNEIVVSELGELREFFFKIESSNSLEYGNLIWKYFCSIYNT